MKIIILKTSFELKHYQLLKQTLINDKFIERVINDPSTPVKKTNFLLFKIIIIL